MLFVVVVVVLCTGEGPMQAAAQWNLEPPIHDPEAETFLPRKIHIQRTSIHWCNCSHQWLPVTVHTKRWGEMNKASVEARQQLTHTTRRPALQSREDFFFFKQSLLNPAASDRPDCSRQWPPNAVTANTKRPRDELNKASVQARQQSRQTRGSKTPPYRAERTFLAYAWWPPLHRHFFIPKADCTPPVTALVTTHTKRPATHGFCENQSQQPTHRKRLEVSHPTQQREYSHP